MFMGGLGTHRDWILEKYRITCPRLVFHVKWSGAWFLMFLQGCSHSRTIGRIFVIDFPRVNNDFHSPSIENIDFHDVRTYRNVEPPFVTFRRLRFVQSLPAHLSMFFLRSSSPTRPPKESRGNRKSENTLPGTSKKWKFDVSCSLARHPTLLFHIFSIKTFEIQKSKIPDLKFRRSHVDSQDTSKKYFLSLSVEALPAHLYVFLRSF